MGYALNTIVGDANIGHTIFGLVCDELVAEGWTLLEEWSDATYTYRTYQSAPANNTTAANMVFTLRMRPDSPATLWFMNVAEGYEDSTTTGGTPRWLKPVPVGIDDTPPAADGSYPTPMDITLSGAGLRSWTFSTTSQSYVWHITGDFILFGAEGMAPYFAGFYEPYYPDFYPGMVPLCASASSLHVESRASSGNSSYGGVSRIPHVADGTLAATFNLYEAAIGPIFATTAIAPLLGLPSHAYGERVDIVFGTRLGVMGGHQVYNPVAPLGLVPREILKIPYTSGEPSFGDTLIVDGEEYAYAYSSLWVRTATPPVV